MIPILCDTSKSLATLVTDSTNGLGKLSECISCRIIEERNGMYDMTFTLPISAKHFKDIQNGGVVKVKTQTYGMQLFRIYKISKEFNGVVTVDCHHISYDMAKAPVLPFTSTGAITTMTELNNHLAVSYPFTISTDIANTTSKFTLDVPKAFRECLGGYEGSILDVFGGEYEWDNLNIRLLASRGADNGVRVAYGKNLTDLNQEENIESVYNAVLGYAVVDDRTYTGDIQYVGGSSFSNPNVKLVDFSDDYENDDVPTTAQLSTKAANYIATHEIGVPNVNLEISFVPLWETEEYKDIAPLEAVSLCDTVHVEYPALGVTASAKVIQTEWDVINERYLSMQLGDARTTLSTAVEQSIQNGITEHVSSVMDSAIDHATAMITGGLGGYVVLGRNADGQPEEILILDNPDKYQAVNVIRMNRNGIGFSNNGYNGTYRNAWTIDGQFLADNITGGTMSAGSIEGVDISGGIITSLATQGYRLQMSNGVFAIYDEDGNILGDFYANQNGDSGSIMLMDRKDSSNIYQGYLTGRYLQAGFNQATNRAMILASVETGTTQITSLDGNMYFIVNDTAIAINAPGNYYLSLNKNGKLTINVNSIDLYINGSGYTNLGFVNDGNGHSVLGK